MKNILLITLTLIGGTAFGQLSSNDTITKTIKFENQDAKNVFYVANINGSITAKPVSGTEIKVTAKRRLLAKTQARMNEAKELSLQVKDRLDTLILYVQGACGNFSKSNRNWNNGKDLGGWGYNWNNCDEKYDFRVDITVEVPSNQRLILSTINKGDIDVTNLDGDIKIRNVNGAISVTNAGGNLNARTINGDVDLKYKKTPSKEFSLYTLNGDIRADYPSELNADIKFKSFNGDFYTNESVAQLPMSLKRSEAKNERGIKYKIGTQSILRFNQGGFMAEVETFNGDVFLTNLALKN